MGLILDTLRNQKSCVVHFISMQSCGDLGLNLCYVQGMLRTAAKLFSVKMAQSELEVNNKSNCISICALY